MEADVALRIGREALLLTLLLTAPPVLAAMLVGLFVSLFQAATQLQEQTLTFVPKLVAVFVVLAVSGMWMISQLMKFSMGILENLPRIVH
ncbi:MAG: flagellar biosynthesis protein FliQ [Phycisphaerae bacterium]